MPYYEMTINLTIIFSVLWVAITETKDIYKPYIILSLCINFCFLFELIVEIITHNSVINPYKWRVYPEVCSQILNLGAIVSVLRTNDSVSDKYITIKLF